MAAPQEDVIACPDAMVMSACGGMAMIVAVTMIVSVVMPMPMVMIV